MFCGAENSALDSHQEHSGQPLAATSINIVKVVVRDILLLCFMSNFSLFIKCPTQCYAVYKEIQISFHLDEKQATSLVLPKEKDMFSHQH